MDFLAVGYLLCFVGIFEKKLDALHEYLIYCISELIHSKYLQIVIWISLQLIFGESNDLNEIGSFLFNFLSIQIGQTNEGKWMFLTMQIFNFS